MKTDYKNMPIPDFLVVLKWLTHENKCMSDLHNELGIMYVHLHTLKHQFLNLGWVTKHKEGRRHELSLTEKGQEMVDIANNLLEKMGISDEMIRKYISTSKRKKNSENDEEKEE